MKKILVLGNSVDRKNQVNFIKNWENEIIGCNRCYEEYETIPITQIFSVHDVEAKKALSFKKDHNLDYQIFSPKFINDEIKLLNTYRGWSSGTEAINWCVQQGYEEIWLAGFEFVKGQDIYQDKKLFCGNFEKQFIQITQENPKANIFWAPFDDPESNLRKESLKRIPQEEVIFKKSTLSNQSIFEKFKNYCKEKNDVVIIGNSPIVLEKELGKMIDEFTYVVRINDYIIEGFEKNIGSKTTFWATGASFSTKVKGRKIEEVIPLVFIPPARYEKEQKPSITIEKNLEVPIEKLCIIDREDIKAIHQYSNIEYMSTGLMSIIYFAMILKMDTTIWGFCQYQENKAHYYDNEPPSISPLHNFDKEFVFIDSLVESNKIKRLG